MKIKYLSDDGHEFESKTHCEKYEQALEEVNHITKLPVKVIDGKQWFKINSVGEFYFFDHMDDRNGAKSNKTLYDISQIVSKITHYMPYWITKDFEEGIMIDKKRIEVIDKSIGYLNDEIEKLKEEKKNLEDLRGIEITDDDYKLLVEPQKQEPPKTSPPVQQNVEVENESEGSYASSKPQKVQENVIPLGQAHAKSILENTGVQLDPRDIVELAMEEAQVSASEWNQFGENKRKNLIEEQINILI